ncbi:MAG TPA: DMT family transporter [Longimicrobium sp.]|jgi:drug/metabolite transporter (DMT)-like permease
MSGRGAPDGRARAREAVPETPELEGMAAEVEPGEPGEGGDAAGGRLPRFSAGLRYMAAGAFFFSVMSLLVKMAGRRLPSQEIVLVRAVVTLALSWWAVRRARVAPWGNNRPRLVLRGIVGFLALSGFYYSVVHLPLADATVIQYTNPVFAVLLAVPVLHERLRAREVLVVLVSMAGVVVATRPTFLFGHGEGALDHVAVGIGLFAAMCSAAAYVTVRSLRGREEPLVIVFYFALVSTLGALATGLPGAVWPTGTEWLVLLGVGVTTQLGQVSITRGLHLERAGRATATAYLQIVFAALWGALFFAELPDAGTAAGAVLIVAGTLALARREETPEAEPAS